jgi:hypothetical protein
MTLHSYLTLILYSLPIPGSANLLEVLTDSSEGL